MQIKHSLSVALTLSLLTLAPAQARETKTVIVLESLGASEFQCDPHGTSDAERLQQCLEVSESGSKDLRGEVFVEMSLDSDCAGMAFADNFIDLGNYGKGTDYINAVVTYLPATNENTWWLNIVTINGRTGPDHMDGKASNAKEIAHKLCYIIHQEKMTRR
jgi:hypothetical protein